MGILKKIGGYLNDVMGVSSSAKDQANSQMTLQKDAQDFAKWQMGNAHQMETQDLIKSGINPILSANGGASAGVSQGTATVGVGADPISIITNIINTMNNSAKTKADIKNTTDKTKAEINKLLKEAGYTEKQIEYYNKHGVFPGATTSTKVGINGGFGLFGGNTEITEPVGLKGGKVDPKTYTETSAKKTKTKRFVKDMSAYL